MSSFLANESFFVERSIGGRPYVPREVRSLNDLAYLGRWVNSWDLSDEVTMKLGFSGAYGPNATGPDGQTLIYGADLKMKWRPVNNFRGWPFLLLQTEIMRRNYYADSFLVSEATVRVGTRSTCRRRPLSIGDFMLNCSGDSRRIGPPGSDLNMSAEAATMSISIHRPETLKLSRGIWIPSGMIGTASLLCSCGNLQNSPAFVYNTTMIGTNFPAGGMRPRFGSGWSSCSGPMQPINTKTTRLRVRLRIERKESWNEK